MIPAMRGSLGWPFRQLVQHGCLWLAIVAGCAAERPRLARQLPPAAPAAVRIPYHVHSPDVLELRLTGRPDLSGKCGVGADGRIDLGELGRLRVDGRTAPEIADLVARSLQIDRDQVAVQIVEYNSQQIYLYGQVNGAQRPVPYQGGEPVLHVLQRVGGITPGAEPDDIYVIRTHLAEGRAPEVFHIQLRDILSGKDPRTNLVLQPFDEVYVGETRKSCLLKCLPPCFRPFFKSICGLRRPCSLGPTAPLPPASETLP
jgi:protein involved in polysaccharide export with SLBB domain